MKLIGGNCLHVPPWVCRCSSECSLLQEVEQEEEEYKRRSTQHLPCARCRA